MPLPTNTAHTFTAADKISGEDSAVNAGVSAAPICAYYMKICMLKQEKTNYIKGRLLISYLILF